MNDEVDTAKVADADASLARDGAPKAGCGYREGGDRFRRLASRFDWQACYSKVLRLPAT